jgi:hypothetical protein
VSIGVAITALENRIAVRPCGRMIACRGFVLAILKRV